MFAVNHQLLGTLRKLPDPGSVQGDFQGAETRHVQHHRRDAAVSHGPHQRAARQSVAGKPVIKLELVAQDAVGIGAVPRDVRIGGAGPCRGQYGGRAGGFGRTHQADASIKLVGRSCGIPAGNYFRRRAGTPGPVQGVTGLPIQYVAAGTVSPRITSDAGPTVPPSPIRACGRMTPCGPMVAPSSSVTASMLMMRSWKRCVCTTQPRLTVELWPRVTRSASGSQ